MENQSVVARSQGWDEGVSKWDSRREFWKDQAVCILTVMVVIKISTCSKTHGTLQTHTYKVNTGPY